MAVIVSNHPVMVNTQEQGSEGHTIPELAVLLKCHINLLN
jgi:hypothetical protein